MKNVSNVSVKLHGGMGFALNFDWKSFPHHVWIDAQSRAIDKTLYRHSTADRGNPGYFQTRHLDAFKGENFKAIRQAFDIAVNGLMFEKAIQAKKAREEKEAADRNATIEHTKQMERYKEAGPYLVEALDGANQFLTRMIEQTGQGEGNSPHRQLLRCRFTGSLRC